MRNLTAIATMVVLLASACSSTVATPTDAQPQAIGPATPTAPEPEQLAFSTDEPDPDEDVADTGEVAAADDIQDPAGPEAEPAHVITMDDLTRFIAAAEAELVGSNHQGVMYAAPEIYIASAQVFCARLSQGDALGLIIDDYIAQVPAPISDDDYLLAGAILGAGVETLCPEHGSEI